MDHFSRLGLALFILLLLSGIVAASPTAVQPATIHTIYLPLVSSASLQHGGPHPWPHATITPTPEVYP